MTDNLIYCYDSTGAHRTCDLSPSLSCRLVFQATDCAQAFAGLNPGIPLTSVCTGGSYHLPAHILAPVPCQLVPCAALMHSLQVLLQTKYIIPSSIPRS